MRNAVSIAGLCLLFLGFSGCQSSDPDSNTTQFDEEEIVIAQGSDEPELDYPEPAQPAEDTEVNKVESTATANSGNATPTPQPLLSPEQDLLARMRPGFQLNRNYQTSRIDVQLKWFANNPDYLERVNKRGSRYLYHIVGEIEKRDIPMEFALLPIVESAYDPFAYSHGRASGIWQFIPATGAFMGLQRDWWYDGRRDIVASTDAALNLLERLHSRLGNDWLLALAAYNSGEGNVRKAIRKNEKLGKPTDFWHLDLPRETRAYVPKLLALARLYADPDQYQLQLYPVANEPYFASVDIGSQIDLAQAARLADISLEELYLLNPGFNRWATRPQGPHQLLVPVDKAEHFANELALLPPEQRITWERYTIKSGDTLSTIAQSHNISVSNLKSINNLSSSQIRAGKTLMIPVASANHYSLSQDARLATIQNTQRGDGSKQKITYTVKPGDSFWTISRHYRVSMKQLARWNGMAVRDPLRSGQKLVVWVTPEIVATAVPPQSYSNPNSTVRKVSYRVRNGDSLSLISSKFNVSISNIVKWNQLDVNRYLQPGQRLTLFVDVTNAH